MNETRDPRETPGTTEAGMVFADMDMQARMKWIRRKTIEHIWGPTGSVVLHVLLILAAMYLFTGMDMQRTADIEVLIVEPDTTELEEFERELDRLQEIAPDFDMPQFEVMVETPPDVRPTDVVDPMTDIAELDIRTAESPLVMRGLLAGRSASGRARMIRDHGGRVGEATDAAVQRALEWLKEHQLEDGSWQGTSAASSKTAMTGLGLLTFLAYGQTHRSERYGQTVERAIRFLVEQDLQADGSFRHVDGGWYGHGIAAYALSEAYAMTRIPSVKPAMERAIGRIIQGQQQSGGFTYRLPAAHTRRDTSVAGWMAQAMKAAFIAGAEVPGLKEAMDRTIDGLMLNYHAASSMFAYAPGGSEGQDRPSRSMTPIAVLALQLLGRGGTGEVRSAIQNFANWQPSWTENHPSSWPLYTWYYATQGIFHGGGPAWVRWNDQFGRMLVMVQNVDGSWTPNGQSEAPYGPVYGTTFSALSLMVYYRYLPTYQPIEVEEVPTERRPDEVQVDVS